MLIDVKAAAAFLREQDHIVIFAHRKPDGDTIGSCFALMYALHALGKKARVECSDPLIQGRFLSIFGAYEPDGFEARCLCSADVADLGLLAGVHTRYNRPIDLSIDHHVSNEMFAARTVLNPKAAATAEIVYALILELGVAITQPMADAIFTGLSTDTGCFKYANTTADTHFIAGKMMEAGANAEFINRLMFGTRTRGRILLERHVLDSLEFYFDNRCALVTLASDIAEQHDLSEDEMDGISAIPRSIEGVLAGVTMRTNPDGSFRVSMRTLNPIDASLICTRFGGGGHANAAGCTLYGPLDSAKSELLCAVEEELTRTQDISA